MDRITSAYDYEEILGDDSVHYIRIDGVAVPKDKAVVCYDYSNYFDHVAHEGDVYWCDRWDRYVTFCPDECYFLPHRQRYTDYINEDEYVYDYDEDGWVERPRVLQSYDTNVMNSCTSFVRMPDEKTERRGKLGKNTPFLGVELEVYDDDGCADSGAERVLDYMSDYVICVEDGSLTDCGGFEIVTVPATLRHHKEKLWNNWDPDNLSSYHHDECGIHISISHNAFTPLHLGRFMVFINRNKLFSEMIAQREGCSYAQYKTQHLTDGLKGHQYKYNAVNVCGSRVEVRIFAGNTRKERIFKNLEFVHAVWAYTRQCGNSDLEPRKFLRWLDRQRGKDYENLCKFIVERTCYGHQLMRANQRLRKQRQYETYKREKLLCA
jgi:hypothetical protein